VSGRSRIRTVMPTPDYRTGIEKKKLAQYHDRDFGFYGRQYIAKHLEVVICHDPRTTPPAPNTPRSSSLLLLSYLDDQLLPGHIEFQTQIGSYLSISDDEDGEVTLKRTIDVECKVNHRP